MDHSSYIDMMIFVHSGTSSTQCQVHDIPNQVALSKDRFITSNQSSRNASGGDVNKSYSTSERHHWTLCYPVELMFRCPMTTPLLFRVQMAPDEHRTRINQSVVREKMYANQHTREIIIIPLLVQKHGYTFLKTMARTPRQGVCI